MDDGRMKEQMLQFINQMKGSQDKRIAKQIQQMAPLYEPHSFWDTQPVPKVEFAKKDAKVDILLKFLDWWPHREEEAGRRAA